MSQKYDCLVIGAGFAGAVCARELAERGGKRVLVLERRVHIGGNAYDKLDEAGVLIHQYGPHIFHTNNARAYEYLSRFTGWRDYQHRVVANVRGALMPVPFNLTSLELAYGSEKAARLEKKLIETYGAEKKVTILELRRNDDPEIKALADYVYENVFVHYTMKQWGQTPEEIDPNTTARVPVFLSRDDRYFQDAYQGIPALGYTAVFEHMLDHPNITVELDSDAADQSVNEKVMVGRVDQQVRVTRLMIEAHNLRQVRAANPKLGRYMRNYLAMMMTISSIFLIIDGSPEALGKKTELWEYLRAVDAGLYHKLKYRAVSFVGNIPGYQGRKLSVSLYRMARKIYKFN